MKFLDEVTRVAQEAECLYTMAEVSNAITLMAKDITEKLANSHPVVLCVLNGGISVTGELVMQLAFPLELDSVKAGRYQGKTSGTEMNWQMKPSTPLKSRTVLIVDDILDEGITLAAIAHYCKEQGAEFVYTAVLVDKIIGRAKPCHADFIGLTTPDRYLFGYGLDYKGHLRNWPGIFACTNLY